jgi:hypothetical protein
MAKRRGGKTQKNNAQQPTTQKTKSSTPQSHLKVGRKEKGGDKIGKERQSLLY